ncbi:MAG TPA: SDR family oxidoreductase [Mycobacteriales bacterium]|jgi:NAD(P)-dependent dehydrogenase (short-subunit alcohol dehydrogenase family)|nr:SDR family oxidoreductase [Mycobacteriales bacterium]
MSDRKIAVVSGGSAGVGRAIVQELATHGYDVAVLARGQAGVDAAVAEVTSAGGRGLGIVTDVAVKAEVESAADRVEHELGEIDVWINVAFVGALRFSWDTDPDVFRRITEVTYYGQVHGTLAALARMRPRDRGVILQIGSALALRGIPLQSAYCGAKHAIRGYTESVISELKHEKSNVRVSMIELPGVNTPQFDWNDNAFDEHPMPVPPIFEPEAAARAVRFMVEHRRRDMWVGVPTAYTILGNRVAPWFLDWYLGRTGVQGQLSPDGGPRFGSNVFQPRDDSTDRGAHGAFDGKAHPHDPWSWASMNRVALSTGAATLGLGLAAWRRSRK